MWAPNLSKTSEMAALKKLKLVDKHELVQLIEKQIRQNDPRIRSMALLEKEMGSTLNRGDVSGREIGIIQISTTSI